MKKLFRIIIPLLFISIGLHAQGVDDAIFLSQTRYEGTARSMAMGNATGAMGGDLTAVYINPAALGLYRGGEFTFTTGLQQVNIASSYYGTQDSDHRLRLSIPNVGLVMGGEVSNYKPLRYLLLSFGLTRTNDFNYRTLAQGLNPSSSMVDAFLQAANGMDEILNSNNDPGDYFANNYPFDLNPAWETHLINRYIDSLGQYYFDSPVPPGNVHQKDIISCRGRSEEWTIALAGNFYDKLFVGSSIGLTHLKRIYNRDYTENGNFGNWAYQEELADTAWGINFKCGLVYYPASWLRIGAAWHSRTLSSIGEIWSTNMASTLNNGIGYQKYYSPTLYQTYMFRSPHSFTGSLAILFDSRGMLTADVDYLDYGTSKLKSEEFSFSDANNDIRDLLKPSLNIRIGTEWRFRQYHIRGGAAYYGSPYGFGEKYGSSQKLALGIGYATTEEVLWWDFAYELSRSVIGYTPYQCYVDGAYLVDDIVQHYWRNKLVVTMKMKF